MVYASRVDDNQVEIVRAFRDLGGSVLVTSNLRQGGDIILGMKGANYMFEIKDGRKPPSQRKLTPKEKAFHDSWQGHIEVISSIDDVLHFLKQKNV